MFNIERFKFGACAIAVAALGSQTVHMIYQPMAVIFFLNFKFKVFEIFSCL